MRWKNCERGCTYQRWAQVGPSPHNNNNKRYSDESGWPAQVNNCNSGRALCRTSRGYKIPIDVLEKGRVDSRDLDRSRKRDGEIAEDLLRRRWDESSSSGFSPPRHIRAGLHLLPRPPQDAQTRYSPLLSSKIRVFFFCFKTQFYPLFFQKFKLCLFIYFCD